VPISLSMGSRRSNPSVKPGQKNPIDSNTIRSSSLRDYTPSVVLIQLLETIDAEAILALGSLGRSA